MGLVRVRVRLDWLGIHLGHSSAQVAQKAKVTDIVDNY